MVTSKTDKTGQNTEIKSSVSFSLHNTDTGSVEVQIANLTERINQLSSHFKTNPKDFSSRRGLLNMISRRKKFLTYLKSNKKDSYLKILAGLNLRK